MKRIALTLLLLSLACAGSAQVSIAPAGRLQPNTPLAASELRAATLRSAAGASDAIQLHSSGSVKLPVFAAIGPNSPNIKTKRLTFTGPAAEGDSANISHGLGASYTSILALYGTILGSGTSVLYPVPGMFAGASCTYTINNTNIVFTTDPNNSANILGGNGTIFLVIGE